MVSTAFPMITVGNPPDSLDAQLVEAAVATATSAAAIR